jgi:hypothetical protein
VQSLALASRGRLCTAPADADRPAEFARWGGPGDPAFRGCWRGAGTKPAERALEKLLRSYDCDVSRLLDCCRQVGERRPGQMSSLWSNPWSNL